MMKVKFNFFDGTSSEIDEIQKGSVVLLPDGTGSYFLESGFIQYHFSNVKSFDHIDPQRGANP
jgi:hypothetical protein